MKNYIIKINLLYLVILILFASCETLDLEQTIDPNKATAANIDVKLAFNYVQLQLPDFVNSANSFTQRVTRQMAMTGGTTYDNAFEPLSSNTNWKQAYDILNIIKLLEPKATLKRDFYAIGASKVIRCYVLATLVDLYGDIPYSEALQGSANFFPKFDKSSDVYKGILVELEDAKSTLLLPNAGTPLITDLYYGSKEDWIRLANTIKLKMLITSRLAPNEIGITNIKDEIESIISSGNYITTSSQDFQFKFGKQRLDPQSRHPQYYNMYELGGGSYIGNYMFWTMTTEKGFSINTNGLGSTPNYDPRTGFYFFKQEAILPTGDLFAIPFRSRPDHYNDIKYNSFYDSNRRNCYTLSNWTGQVNLPSDGYLGRDHGNSEGTPADNNIRTVTGLYPIGGEIGTPVSTQTSGTKGALGQGIMPIILSSYVKFLKAEAMLKLGVAGDAKLEMLDAVKVSIDKTVNFLPDFPRPSTVNTSLIESQKVNYIDFLSTRYDAFTNNDDRLEMIIKEYYIASWGNGIEPYNNYRRTGFPSNFQPTLELESGVFFSTAYYPLTSQNNNPNMPKNVRTKKVFWDKSSLILH